MPSCCESCSHQWMSFSRVNARPTKRCMSTNSIPPPMDQPLGFDTWLSFLRIGFGLQVVFYCLLLESTWRSLFAGPAEALLSRELSEFIVARQSPLVPNVSWLVTATGRIGLHEDVTLSALWIALLLAGVCLALGLMCRTAAVTAWLLHLCAAKSSYLLFYGVDNFMTIGLFYLMLAPLPDAAALDWKLWKPKSPDPQRLGFFRLALQVHL